MRDKQATDLFYSSSRLTPATTIARRPCGHMSSTDSGRSWPSKSQMCLRRSSTSWFGRPAMIATLKIIHYSEQIIIKLKLNHEQVKSEEV
jgi:hypothetical protein